jgi:Na+/proline symporter
MSSTIVLLLIILIYCAFLFWISEKRGKVGTNDTFFRASRNASWPMVAVGMIGASISGVSLISVPGWVQSTQMTYLQMCLGFVVGYAICAFVLLPIYYKWQLTSIYEYLHIRFGAKTHQTGTLFFLLSKFLGASARLYICCLVVHEILLAPFQIPFALTAGIVLLLIWGYTRHRGIATLIQTDVIQTLCMIISLILLFIISAQHLGFSFQGIVEYVQDSEMSRIFEWDGSSRQSFWKQFLSGIFIVIVMTGLDQDMMQKNLTCRNLRSAQKNMCTYGLCFVPINFLLLVLGILFCAIYTHHGVSAPINGDTLLPHAISSGWLGNLVIIPFGLAMVSATLSSADSALTALTTSTCVDLLRLEQKANTTHNAQRIRQRIHLIWAVALFLGILCIKGAGQNNIIDTIYVLASYSYGPLLGMYAFGLFTRRRVIDHAVPFIALASPLLCGTLDFISPTFWRYTFGYELLLLNGAITFIGLLGISRKQNFTDSTK